MAIDSGWDKPLRNVTGNLLWNWKFSDLPVEYKISKTGAHYDYNWLYGNLCTWDTMYRGFLLFSALSYLADHYHFLVQ